jgi:putative restriction endonuclease
VVKTDDSAQDTRVRLAAFKWLEEQTSINGDVLSWSLLIQGFEIDGERVPMVSMQGIFKPRLIPKIPLSIRTSIEGPYNDEVGYDELLRYAYRGTDPNHRDNVGLREAMRLQVPLAYFYGLVEGRYLAIWPVYIVNDSPGSLMFTVAVDQSKTSVATIGETVSDANADLRRRYATRETRQRLHQSSFRERVLEAYRKQCALCRLRHPELLEAAHIIPDTEPGGDPVVPNGISLCRLHHGAFDRYFIGIRPDYTVEVRRSILEETDGPMLRHGLQGAHNQRIWTPRSAERKPNPDLLERRYERFRKAG